MRSIHALATLAAILALALAGCGGDDDDGGDSGGGGGDEPAQTQEQTTPETETGTTPTTPEETEEPAGDAAAAEQTVRDYIDGVIAGDGAKVCDQFTRSARRELDQIGGCEDLFDGLLTALSEEQKEELRSTDPQVEVNGDRATATVPSLEGGGEETLNMRKEGGEWKIAESASGDEGP